MTKPKTSTANPTPARAADVSGQSGRDFTTILKNDSPNSAAVQNASAVRTGTRVPTLGTPSSPDQCSRAAGQKGSEDSLWSHGAGPGGAPSLSILGGKDSVVGEREGEETLDASASPARPTPHPATSARERTLAVGFRPEAASRRGALGGWLCSKSLHETRSPSPSPV